MRGSEEIRRQAHNRCVGALEKGVNAQGEVKVRVVHYGSNEVEVNHHIKVCDAGLFPLSTDLKTCLRTQSATGQKHTGLTADVEGAHRIIAIRPKDWPLQACQVKPKGDVYLNRRGTFGISSASYWWGKLAAGTQRGALLILGPELPLWLLLYADDYNLT